MSEYPELTEREVQLVRVLETRPEHIWSHRELNDALFGGSAHPSTLRHLARDVRLKLGKQFIDTFHSRGYRLGKV